MRRKGILLVNMGGPQSLPEMKFFLKKMFRDPHILPFNVLGRFLLGTLITNLRYKKSWQKYQKIGGTPLVQSTKLTVEKLRKALPGACIKYAFSYSAPLVKDAFAAFREEGVKEVLTIPLYPHFSITTFRAVTDDANRAAEKTDGIKNSNISPYYKNEKFIRFWKNIILEQAKKAGAKKPLLLFSAHSIPLSFIKKGDNYPEHISESAREIAEACGLPFKLAYQSQIKGSKWLEPKTELVMDELRKSGTEEIIIVPISFVSENLETLYDIDYGLIPYGKEIGFKNISRAKLPLASDDFTELLVDITRQHKPRK